MKTIVLVLTCFIGVGLNAQRYGLSLESGPSLGAFKKSLSDDAYKQKSSYTLGGGIAHAILFHVRPDSSNWYFTTGFEYFQSNASTISFYELDSNAYLAASRSLNSLRFQAQLAYSFNIGKFNLDLRAGLLLPLLGSTTEYQYHKDTSYNSLTLLSLDNYPSVGFKGGINFSGPLVKNAKWKWFFNMDLTLLNSKVKSSKVFYYTDTEEREMESIYPDRASQEILFRKDPSEIRNNEAVLPARFDKNQPTDKLTYSQSISSFNFRVGLLYNF